MPVSCLNGELPRVRSAAISTLAWACLVPLLSACEEEVIARLDSQLVAEPSELDLGDVVVGLTGRTELSLHNTGSALLTLTRAAPDDELGGEVTLENVPEKLAAGEKVAVQVVFAPTTPGERRGKLVFETSSAKTPSVTVEVVARGVEPALIANPPVLDFGRVVVGRTESATVTLTNRSDRPVEVVRAALDQGTSAEYSSEAPRITLEAGATLSIQVRYAPIDLGTDEGRVVIIDSSPRPESLGIRVRGEGVESDVLIEPVRLEFSGLYVGQEQTQIFWIRNIGQRDHDVSELVFASSGADAAGELTLTASASLPLILAPGGAQQVSVTYRPIDAGTDGDRVRVVSTGLPAPGFVEIVASAGLAPAPQLVVTPAALAFGQVEIGTMRPLPLRLANAGNAPLVIESVELSPGTAPYGLSNTPAPMETFAPNDQRDVQVTFLPAATGAAPAASVVITSNDPANPVITVPLTGEGINSAVPIINVTPNPVDFGRVPRGVNASRSIQVRNDGSAPLVLNQIRLTADAAGRFRLPAPPAAMTRIDPGQLVTFSADYLDNGVVATYTGSLELASNDPARPVVVVQLRAETEPPPPVMTDIVLTMTWSRTPADVDLHLVAPGRSFFNVPGDCCFCNANPDWGGMGQPQDNPFLDRDDVIGPGPENINLSQAASGEYQVIAHFYSDAGGGPTDVRVQVSLRGNPVADVTRTLSRNDRWIAGTITWDAATRTGTWRAGTLPPFPTLLRACL